MNLVGKTLGNRYEILEEIGSGGMAYVYRAHCTLLNRFVAIKVLREDLKDDREFVKRFYIEAQAAASLTHPNIVSIYDVGRDGDLYYIVMEYVEGRTLKEYLDEQGKLPWREAAEYAAQICRALEVAHKNSIVHRDIKPQNIIMTPDGTLKVTDFGIARASTNVTQTLSTGAMGTVQYLSPEQARGGFTDERSDIYSLGIVLYEMVTGTVPFSADSAVTTAIKHIQEQPTPPRELNLSIPHSLENIILKAIRKEQSGRYRTAVDMLRDLTMILENPNARVADDGLEFDMGMTRKMPEINDRAADDGTRKYSFDLDETSAVRDSVRSRTPRNRYEDSSGKEEETMRKSRSGQKFTNKKKSNAVQVAAIIIAVAVVAAVTWMIFHFVFSGATGDVEVPKIIGMTINEAREQYPDFEIVCTDNTVDETADKIIEQTPEARMSVRDSNKIIKVKVESAALDTIEIENYAGRYGDEVEEELTNLGLKVTVKEQGSDTVEAGKVVRQSLREGRKVSRGTKITIYVSDGSPGSDNPDEDENNEDEDNGNNDSDRPTSTPKPNNSNTSNQNDNNSNNDNSGGNGGSSGGSDNSGGSNATKSTYLTVYGPSNKDSALVQVRVNGSEVYSKTLSSGADDMVKIVSSSSTANVEILHDGVVVQQQTVTLN